MTHIYLSSMFVIKNSKGLLLLHFDVILIEQLIGNSNKLYTWIGSNRIFWLLDAFWLYNVMCDCLCLRTIGCQTIFSNL